MKTIDSHQHVFWHGRDDAGLIADMDEHGIDLAWLLTWEIPQFPACAETTQFSRVLNPARARPDGTHPGILLEDLLAARRAHPTRFLVGYCPDPAKPNAPDLFEAACDMHGVRICGEWKFRMLLDDPRSLEIFRAAGRRNAPVVLHLDVPYLGGNYCEKWYGGTVDNLARALEACPDNCRISDFSASRGCSGERMPQCSLPAVPQQRPSWQQKTGSFHSVIFARMIASDAHTRGNG